MVLYFLDSWTDDYMGRSAEIFKLLFDISPEGPDLVSVAEVRGPSFFSLAP